jgi:F0F1-type ATP synthase membrane subunit a
MAGTKKTWTLLIFSLVGATALFISLFKPTYNSSIVTRLLVCLAAIGSLKFIYDYTDDAKKKKVWYHPITLLLFALVVVLNPVRPVPLPQAAIRVIDGLYGLWFAFMAVWFGSLIRLEAGVRRRRPDLFR